METALCLIENNQPVFPLAIVRQMREQRLGMIQTAVRRSDSFFIIINIASLESIPIRL